LEKSAAKAPADEKASNIETRGAGVSDCGSAGINMITTDSQNAVRMRNMCLPFIRVRLPATHGGDALHFMQIRLKAAFKPLMGFVSNFSHLTAIRRYLAFLIERSGEIAAG
jgi:hypothetical protein